MEQFDYIIVGGGSAGCVLAARLTEDPGTRVLLLEAGGTDWHPFIHIPLTAGKLRQANMYDWGYSTSPQPHLDHRNIRLLRGKVLGGSSSVNFMAHNRGNRSDYERWVRMGHEDWSYENLLPYFKRMESWREGTTPHRGSNGPIGIRYTCRSDPLGWAMLEAAKAAGHPIFDDLNGPEPNGFGLAQSAIDKGRRASSSTAYLRPALKRPNLVVRTRCLITKIILDKRTARGVQYLRDGQIHEVGATREVILAAGAVNSPQLLMLSGIGDADALRKLGITPFQHLPGVGSNLQDHLVISLIHRRIGEDSPLHRMMRVDRLIPSIIAAYVAGKGPATSLPAGVNGILRTSEHLDAPDLQVMFGAGALEAKPWFPGINDWKDVLYLRPVLSHPVSTGSVTLASADPTKHPIVDPRYLSHQDDLKTLRKGFRIVREIMQQKELDPFRGEELSPGPSSNSDDDIDAHIRQTASTAQHLSCTCKMGADPMAVVDTQLRVHGVNGLRVVDASVMPEIVSCNIHALVLAIAEKAADLIRGHQATTKTTAQHAVA